MRITKTSIATLAALGFAVTATSASACEWYKQQVQAKAATPPAEQQADTSATPIDPVILARIEARSENEQIEQK